MFTSAHSPIWRRLLAGSLVLLLAAALSGCNSASTAQEVWGRAEAKEVDVNSKIPGRVTQLLVKEGDMVEKGQLLARIDSRDIVAKADQAKAGADAIAAQLSQSVTVTALQDQTLLAAVNSAKAQLDSTATNLELTRKDYERFTALAASGAVSVQTADTYRTKYETAQASYTAAQAALAAAQASLLQNKVNRDNEAAMQSKLAQAQAAAAEVAVYLDETEIRAPFSGIVTAKYVEEGAMISTGTPIAAIQDPLDNWINLKVKETELGQYQLQQQLAFAGRDAALKVSGTVVNISKKAEFATYRATNERGDSDIITFNVKVQTNSPQIRPGMRFKVLSGG